MTIKGGIIETKELGLSVNLTGEYYNTELIDGKLRLKLKNDSQKLYEDSGYWISEVVNIGDNFREFDKLISQIDIDGNSKVEMTTRSSINGVDFNAWIPLDENNQILSPKSRYAQIRIEIKAGLESENTIVDKSEYDKELTEVVTDGSDDILKLKKEFNFDITLDGSWTEEGSLHRNNIIIDDWLRIDRLNVKDKIPVISKLNTYLPVSETNWVRYNFSNTDVLSISGTYIDYGIAKKALNSSASYFTVKFKGNGIRLLFNVRSNYRASNCIIELDGLIDKSFSTIDSTATGADGRDFKVLYENLNMSNSEHTIKIYGTNVSNSSILVLQSVDVFDLENKFLIFHDGEYKKYNTIDGWSTVSSTLPSSQQFISEGMDSLSPLLDRKVTTLEPLPIADVTSTVLVNGEEGKVFSGVVDLKKYLDLRNMKVEVK